MGAKQSTGTGSPRVRTYSSSGSQNGAGPHMSGASSRARARSLGSYTNPPPGLHIPVSNGSGPGAVGGSPDSDSSPDESAGMPHPQLQGLRNITHSLPLHLFALHGIKCPVCSKFIPPDDIECHLVVCLTKPRITYNEDVLTENKGECVICFEELDQGDTIARLPCLCIYHKGCEIICTGKLQYCKVICFCGGLTLFEYGCIDKWFEKNRSCPEHPND